MKRRTHADAAAGSDGDIPEVSVTEPISENNNNSGENSTENKGEGTTLASETLHQLEVKFMLSVNKNKAKNECIQQ